MATGRVIMPAFPAAVGPNPQKARFFVEVAAGMEFLGLFYELTLEEQQEVLELMRGLAIAAAQRRLS